MWCLWIALAIAGCLAVWLGQFLCWMLWHRDKLIKAAELRNRTHDFWQCARETEHEAWLRRRMEEGEAQYHHALATYNQWLHRRENRMLARLMGLSANEK